MEIFINEISTKNEKKILVCGICKEGCKRKVLDKLNKGIGSLIFSDTRDEYFLDYCLMQAVTSNSDKSIYAVGASIYVEGVTLRSGGIIGNPFDNKQTNDDEIEELINDVYCIGFPGRIGFAFKGSFLDAKFLKEKIELILDMTNEEILPKAMDLLESITDLYILVSDGSGEGGYPLVCGRNKSEFLTKCSFM